MLLDLKLQLSRFLWVALTVQMVRLVGVWLVVVVCKTVQLIICRWQFVLKQPDLVRLDESHRDAPKLRSAVCGLWLDRQSAMYSLLGAAVGAWEQASVTWGYRGVKQEICVEENKF